jgi:polysulfide reductase chain C
MERSAADAAWQGWLPWYLFLAGLAAGSYAVAALAVVFGDESDRRATRAAFYLAFPLLAACAALLILGGDPARARIVPGAAVTATLAAFGAFSFGSFLSVLAEDARSRSHRRQAGRAFAAVGAIVALSFGATAGHLLRPSWTSAAWLGAVLLASAVSTGVSVVVLLDRWSRRDLDEVALERLGHVNGVAIVAELAVLAGQALSMRGPSGLAYMRWPGMLIPLFVVPFGLVLPLIIGESRGTRGDVDVAILVLLGGFVLRVAVVGIPASLMLR